MADQKQVDPKIAEERKVKSENWKKSVMLLKELVDKTADKKYIDALKVIRPSLYGGSPRAASGPRGDALYLVLSKMIATKKNVQEDELFKAFRIGRREAQALLKTALRKAAPAERVWINFDDEKGVYSLVGTGEKAPANYLGYVPIEEKVDLKPAPLK
jgi:hypothetical protein